MSGLNPPPAAPPSIQAILDGLDRLEDLFCRMIVGIFHFLTHGLPRWLCGRLIDLGRITAKAARVLAVFTAWAALTFLPLLVLLRMPGTLPVLIAVAWTALALGGSVWGILYATRWRPRLWRRRAAAPAHAGTSNGLPSPERSQGFAQVGRTR